VTPQRQLQTQDYSTHPITDIKTETDFRIWFTYYYLHKSPELVSAAVKFMDKNEYMSVHPDIVTGFLGHLFSQYPDHIKDWLKDWDDLDKRSWSVILLSLWMSSNDKAHVLMRINIDRAEPSKVAALKALTTYPLDSDLFELIASDPRHINILWAAFSASGDTRYVEKIISYVEQYEDKPVSRQAKIAETAIMSLATNALQHEAVARVCIEQYSSNPSPKIRMLLDAMLTALANARSSNVGLSH
jgi:hypothetical protein